MFATYLDPFNAAHLPSAGVVALVASLAAVKSIVPLFIMLMHAQSPVNVPDAAFLDGP